MVVGKICTTNPITTFGTLAVIKTIICIITITVITDLVTSLMLKKILAQNAVTAFSNLAIIETGVGINSIAIIAVLLAIPKRSVATESIITSVGAGIIVVGIAVITVLIVEPNFTITARRRSAVGETGIGLSLIPIVAKLCLRIRSR
tara:strand:+ start:556 stop:996 length:441 start_codon:yes stop_codon:yes gene_type:complete